MACWMLLLSLHTTVLDRARLPLTMVGQTWLASSHGWTEWACLQLWLDRTGLLPAMVSFLDLACSLLWLDSLLSQKFTMKPNYDESCINRWTFVVACDYDPSIQEAEARGPWILASGSTYEFHGVGGALRGVQE